MCLVWLNRHSDDSSHTFLMPRPRLHADHAARQAAYRARRKEKVPQALAQTPVGAVAPLPSPPLPCPLSSSACPFFSGDCSPAARSATTPMEGEAVARTRLQRHDEQALRMAADDLLSLAQMRGWLDKADAEEPQAARLYRLGRALWEQPPKS